MAKKLLLCLSILLFTFFGNINAQKLDWVISAGGTGDDGNYDLVSDDSSNLYVTGWFSGSVDLNPGVGVASFSSLGNRDAYISKFNSQGLWQWSSVFGGFDQDEGSVITRDSSGNILVAGRFSGTVDFDPGIGVFSLTSNGDRDVYIVKYTSNGVFLWAESYGGSGYDDAERIRVDRLGNIVVVGSFSYMADLHPGVGFDYHTSVGSDDIYMIKLDSNGVFLWSKVIGSSASDDCAGLEIDDQNNYWISGYFSNTCNFGSSTFQSLLTSNGGYDIFVAKYNSQGALKYCNNFGSSSNDLSMDVKIRNDKVYICGYFSLAVDFDSSPNAFFLVSHGNEDFFVALYDTIGNFLWANSGGGSYFDFASCMSILNDGSVFVNGYSSGNMSVQTTHGLVQFTNKGSYDIFVGLLNSQGDIVNFNGIGGGGLDQSRFQTKDNLGNIYLAGLIGSNNVDFSLNNISVSPSFFGQYDAFYSKYSFCSDSLFVSPLVGPTLVCEGDTLIYSLSNISDSINFIWEVPQGWQVVYSSYNKLNVIAGSNSGSVIVKVFNHCMQDESSNIFVNVNQIYFSAFNLSVCKNSPFVFQDSSVVFLVSDTTEVLNYTTINGCDSIIQFNINVVEFINNVNNIMLCNGDSYFVNGNTYVAGGTYYDTILVANSCDSVIITNINLLPSNLSLNPQTVCENTPYIINSHSYSQSGVYLDTLSNIYGCDSIIITNLTVNSVDTSITIIPGGFISNQPNASYQWCECTINGPLPIPGKTNQTFLPDFLGTYSVIVTYNNCTDTSGCFNPTMVGLNSINPDLWFNAYLDPENNQIDVKSKVDFESVELFDITGRIVRNELSTNREVKLNTADLIKGLYVLRVKNGIQSKSLKILIP